VIFAIAPHANQFVDPIVVMRAFKRPVSFLIAAKSMRKKYVAWAAKSLCAIPVERPEDCAHACAGTVMVAKGTTVHGTGTQFAEEMKAAKAAWAKMGLKQDQVFVMLANGPHTKCRAVLDEVVSDSILRLKSPFKTKDKRPIDDITGASLSEASLHAAPYGTNTLF
jgi:glycerol-3-phosphate O-acyltransferase/dihydroxyacetone phosphate acyltransferase